MDYQKFLYQQKKKQKEAKAKSVKVVVKEIRFGPQTDDHDFNFKLKHAKSFLEEGSKVKAYVFFKGRSILFKEQGGSPASSLRYRIGGSCKSRSATSIGRKEDDHDDVSEKSSCKTGGKTKGS